MSRQLSKFNALAVQRHIKPGRYADGGGLYLQVSDKGTKSWLFRFTLNGKSREMGLGSLESVSLAEARGKAFECRKLLVARTDPIHARTLVRQQKAVDAAKSITFDQCAKEYIQAQKPSWKNQKHSEQWESTIATYASPLIGKLPVNMIDTALVRQVLAPIWNTKTETASRLRSRIESVLDWATVCGYRTGENPATWRGNLNKIFPKRTSVQPQKHHKALPINELENFLENLRQRQGIAAKALEFLILSATRTNETVGAKWEEINLPEAVWIIPAERMKAKREHRVPLSTRAIEILRSLEDKSNCTFVFPGPSLVEPISDWAMLQLLKRMNCKVTVHGFRSTFRDWAAEHTNFSREVAEAALAHTIKNKTEAAYRRSDLFHKRRRLMDLWGRFCLTNASKNPKIVPLPIKDTAKCMIV